MQRNWDYEENPFLNVTEHSYDLMFNISEFHFNALKANATDPFFQERLDFYTPFHDGYEKVYTVWKNSGGTQKGETLTVNQLLSLTTVKLSNWEPPIMMVVAKGTPGYTKLFPRGRYPFTTGSIDQRIAAFSTLATALTDVTGLKDVQADVQKFYDQLHDQRSTQQQSKTSTGTGSDAVEAARVDACDAMFENLGNIMAYFSKQRNRIGSFFDLESIRHQQQLIFQRQVKAAATLFIVKHKFAAVDELTFINKGTTNLYFYLGASKDAPFSETGSILVAPGTSITVSAGSIGAPDKAFLLVYNPDKSKGGECEVHFL